MKLIPPDPKRCQAEITPAHGPFVLGPKPRPERCTNKPVVIATETKPGADGQRGQMSLCKECFDVFNVKMPPGFATFESVE